MRKTLAILLLTMASLWSSARAGDTDALLQALADIGSLQGDFEQRQYSEQDRILVESSGSFRLLRPGYFAWEIRSPDSQLIIATPEYIWHHDLDLETVTRRPVTDTAEMSPLQVLGGDENVLRERFDVSHPEEGVFVLTPTQGDAGFLSLRLQLRGATIAAMEIRDKLNQRVEISFDNLDSATVLTAGDFKFVPPPGADQFYYDE